MSIYRNGFTILALSALSAGYVHAAPTASEVQAAATITDLDTDRDGLVSKREAAKNKDLNKKFSSLDSNRDGRLDSAEFARFEIAPSSDKNPAAPTTDPAPLSKQP